MEIIQRFIPNQFTRIRPGFPLKPEYITVHETDNTARGANAEAHARLLEAGNRERVASWHFTVDDHSIYQHIPTNEVAWHAGDGGNGPGNRKSLAVEICVNEDGDFEKAKQNAIWLIRKLMADHNIPIERVVPHHHWTGKNCPRHILTYWDEFIAQVKGAAEAKPAKPAAPAKPSQPAEPKVALPDKVLKPGDRGADVKAVQQALNKLNFKCGVADGIYGPKTQDAVLRFQKAYGIKPYDGIYGPKTRAEMLKHLQ